MMIQVHSNNPIPRWVRSVESTLNRTPSIDNHIAVNKKFATGGWIGGRDSRGSGLQLQASVSAIEARTRCGLYVYSL